MPHPGRSHQSRFASPAAPSLAVLPGFLALALAGQSLHASDDSAPASPDAMMLRFPDISDSQIVFTYDNDLWVASKEGGMALPLSSPPGAETLAKFSPDGNAVAFTANYDGNADIYVMPVTGGEPKRLTYHPGQDRMLDFAADGRILFRSPREAFNGRTAQLFLTSPTGGMPSKVPVPYGEFGTISDDGQWLAYTITSTDTATWKRYRGGLASDVWLYNLSTNEARRITDYMGSDSMPMWHGSRVYYVTDNDDAHRRNIWYFDTQTGKHTQVTSFKDFDVRWPSMGPNEIVFENGGRLWLLDLATEKTRSVSIQVPGDRTNLRTRATDVSGNLNGMRPSPSGKRTVGEVRGDIWTFPAEKGAARNLTRTDNVAERDPAWSPDGKWIAYFSDRSGEYELTLQAADGKGEERQLTHDGARFRMNPVWSPDSKKILYCDKSGGLFLHDIEKNSTTEIDRDPRSGGFNPSWAKDSNWIAYSIAAVTSTQNVVMLYDLSTGQKHRVTDELYNSTSPTFDRNGDWLYYASTRSFGPEYSEIDEGFIYNNSTNLVAVPLRKDIASPWAAQSDEEEVKKDEPKKEDEAKPVDEMKPEEAKPAEQSADGAAAAPADAKPADSESPDEPKTEEEPKKGEEKKVELLKIDLANFEARAIMLPLSGGNYGNLIGGEGKLFFMKYGDGGPELHQYDIKAKEDKTITGGVNGFDLSADGKKFLLAGQGGYAIADAGPGANMSKRINTSGLMADINPRSEWKQIVNDSWRITRDYFYDPNMHGVDWNSVHDRYVALVDFATSREDVNYIIGEMIGELNCGHTYNWGGPLESAPSRSVGMLGCDYELATDADGNTAFRITRIYRGGDQDIDVRSPLIQPNIDVKEGDFLLAVNGQPLDTTREVWAAFQGLAGAVTNITVSAKAVKDDSARDILLEPSGDESFLRHRAWIDANRRYVSEQTNGRVGYVYVPDTGVNGQNELMRQFFGQQRKDGLIIDERWNGGGQIPSRFVELLSRKPLAYWAVRDGEDWRWPYAGHFGPKAMLINGPSGSGGDCFPFFFKQAGLGKLIGMRTWGGLVGISGNPGLIDGGYTAVPTFGFYNTDGTWGIEGFGVAPDIEVLDDPSKMLGGKDPQLDAAIAQVLKEVQENPYEPTPKPKYPDRSGAGVREEDK